MGLPRKLKNFATFVDGNSYIGDMPEVGLPKLTRKMEKYRAGNKKVTGAIVGA
ncbi:MAG: phage tail protein, partial [Stenotrophomonas maltophilia]